LKKTAFFPPEKLIIGPFQGAQIAISHAVSDTSRGSPLLDFEQYVEKKQDHF